MSVCRDLPRWFQAIGLMVVVVFIPIASAGEEPGKDGGKAAGILIDKHDDWISVKVDGVDAPVKYLTGGATNKDLADVLKTLFTVSRVELTYEVDGTAHRLLSIKRHVPKAAGTVTGDVIQNYGWWIEVRPTQGVPEGFACNFPFDKNQETMDKLKELQAGDSVTIRFTTDFERHRIQSLHKNVAPAHGGTPSTKNEAESAAGHDAKKDSGKVAGILIDKNNNWITVKADGEDEPVKYVVEASDKKLQESFKAVFNACRVQLTFKKSGDSRQLVSIKRQILKANGTMTGDVVKVYNDFWVEVKPKHGVADAFAPGSNYNDKDFMALLKGLKKGESVTITYITDFERHRITALRKNAAPSP